MLDFATTAFVSILFLVDPPGTVPAFLALTGHGAEQDDDQDEREPAA